MGAGPVEVSIVAEEIGRVIAPEPFVEAVVLAGGLVAEVGTDEQRGEILGALAEGTLLPAFAHTEPGSRYELAASGVTASTTGEGWTLTGVKEPVLDDLVDVIDAEIIDVVAVPGVLVAPAEPGRHPRTGLFLVKPDAAGLTRTSYATFDGGRAAHVAFDNTPATPLGEAGADQSAAIAATVARAPARLRTSCSTALGEVSSRGSSA